MKLQITLLSILFGLFSTGAVAQTVKSDYEIQKNFKQQYQQYQERIEKVSSPDSAEALIESIKGFDQKYQEHAELLDKALYPSSYSERIEDLKKSSVMEMETLKKMDQQTQKVEELETQVSEYEQNMKNLNRRTDSLEQAMQKSVQSEQQLSGMVREYRQNLEQRDELILAFIDSMVVAYQNMDLQDIQDLENMDQKSRIESDGNALKMIHEISAENLSILEKNSDRLQFQDFMRMAEVQQQFETMWNRLGDKIQEVYDGENAEQLANDTNKNIAEWDQRLKNETFATLKDSLAQNNLGVSSFNSSNELYSSLNNYLDNQIQRSREDASEATYEEYQNFQRFWNNLELRWSGSLADADIMDREQVATISEKVNVWGEHAEPDSTNWIVYLLGASVILALALGVLLVREKQNKSQS